MRTLYPLFLLSILLCGACSYFLSAKKVECCENKAACCFDQMCCLPRYAKAAGAEPKVFTFDTPAYGTWQDLEPPPGSVIIKRGWLSRFNPFSSDEEEQKPRPQPQPQDAQAKQDTNPAEQEEDGGFLGRLWPF